MSNFHQGLVLGSNICMEVNWLMHDTIVSICEVSQEMPDVVNLELQTAWLISCKLPACG